MRQIKVFIIEDELPVINNLRNQLEPIGCDIIPKNFISEAEVKDDYNNQRDLQIIYRRPNYLEKFKEVILEVHDIDLFIIDISLESNQRDEKGIPIIHHLVENIDIYNKGRSKIIVLSRYGESSNMKEKFDQNKITYVSKGANSDYAIVVRNYIRENLKPLNENETTKRVDAKSDADDQEDKTAVKKSNWFKYIRAKNKKNSGGVIRVWLNDNFFHPANYYLDKLIIIVFGVLLIGALAFALIGITSDFYNYHNTKSYSIKSADTSTTLPKMAIYDTNSKVTKEKPEKIETDADQAGTSENKIKILEVVEHIFIYLLPFFILLGFYNFYSATTAVRWRGDSRTTIDFDNSIKGINTSKVILLSALLSFTLIIAIEQVFIKNETEIKTLIAYGVFIIILMTFILLISKENRGHKGN